jgi:hypothetical protein
MVNPEKVATLGAQDIRQRQTKQQTQHNKPTPLMHYITNSLALFPVL